MVDQTADIAKLRQVAARLKQEARDEILHPSRFVEGSDLNGAVKTLTLLRSTENAGN